jgi:hypothetical protein
MMRAPFFMIFVLCACSGGDVAVAPESTMPVPWSLDVDLAGDASFTALARDTSVTGMIQGEISGKVNGFDSAKIYDTVYFSDWEHPEFKARVPLAADGSFRFDAFDVLGDIDGSHTVFVFLRPRFFRYRPAPDTLRLYIDRS